MVLLSRLTTNLIQRLHRAKFHEVLLDFHFWIVIAFLALISILYYMWQDWFPWFWRYLVFEFSNRIIGVPLVLVPLLYVSIYFGWRGALLAWFIVVTLLIPILWIYYPEEPKYVVLNLVFLAMPLAIVMTVAIELYWHKKQKQLMQDRDQERQNYLAQILVAHEDERKRIAQELHDDTIQTLIAVASNASSILSNHKNTLSPEIEKHIEWTKKTAIRLAEDVRRLSLDLRPSMLDDMGLLPALSFLIDNLRHKTNIETRLTIIGEVRPLKPEEDVIIFRIIQEALNNVQAHSKATCALIELQFQPSLVRLIVRDNGIGFRIEKTMALYSSEGKWGLIGMQQRAKIVNGSIDIASDIGKGTTLSFILNC